MTVLEQKIRVKQQAMAKMLAKPSYFPHKFNKLLEQCKKLQALTRQVIEPEY